MLYNLYVYLFCRQGKVEDSITYLKKFVEVAENSGEEVALSKACHNLGNIFNTLVSLVFIRQFLMHRFIGLWFSK